jgi:hypothetical protein
MIDAAAARASAAAPSASAQYGNEPDAGGGATAVARSAGGVDVGGCAAPMPNEPNVCV